MIRIEDCTATYVWNRQGKGVAEEADWKGHKSKINRNHLLAYIMSTNDV